MLSISYLHFQPIVVVLNLFHRVFFVNFMDLIVLYEVWINRHAIGPIPYFLLKEGFRALNLDKICNPNLEVFHHKAISFRNQNILHQNANSIKSECMIRSSIAGTKGIWRLVAQ
ncbi:hypothetical protein AQUCO_06100068v1 [Aquilegia coerulea]|uniref:Uncharacterized protein n=1 Tax=Aquilegia coerulea TaxID=218851 RepID=A0A2G5CDE9_AQUCA|nr:hypothetical protein AQUCO_06100068v1 [Aquilegia coerulea]